MTVVIAPVDGSKRALRAVPWAARLAGSDGSVVLVRAIPAEPNFAEGLFAILEDADHERQLQDAWQAAAMADLDEAAATIDDPAIAVERAVAAGDPDEVIVSAVDRFDADMIAMASHGRGAIGRAIFGSVADRVARTSPVPVLILRTPDEKVVDRARVSRVIVPLDGSPLAEEALPVAAEVAEHLNAPVYVVRAVDPINSLPMAPGTLAQAPSVSAEVVDRVWQEAETEARRTVSDAVARLRKEGIDASGATLNGSPFFAISEITRPDDLLILTSHGRGGFRRWLLGSVAEKLVREAPAPVMLVPASARIAAAE